MERNVNNELLVVGGGAAGLIAAWRAAEQGAQVTLLEKNDRLGMKILISGGGKCNLTHAGTMEEVRSAFRTVEARFLKPAFYRFTNEDFLAILHRAGMATYVRPDGRVFPVEPGNAKDVVAILERVVRGAGVRVVSGAGVTGVETTEANATEDGVSAKAKKRVVGVRVGEKLWRADRVVVAVGGASYPATGTTGDGWRWASELGHTVVPLRAALAPLYLESAVPEWSGVALRDVILRVRTVPPGAQVSGQGKEYMRWRGDLLFTHKGLSGPCALGVSREVAERMAAGVPLGGVLEVDLVPDTPYEALQTELKTELRDNPRKTVGGVVDRYVPERLADSVLVSAGVEAPTRGAHLPAKTLNRLVTILKGWPLGGVRSVPLEKGEVVAGGISLDEVDPQTMESKRVAGLYLCGEILDIAGPVGGYNLQAAWSTGYVAGDSASKNA